jgi:L-cysteine:1D-myo-inositol 2-amino-2-deoxy-alpha-D-glucopyranoside ligase
MTQTKENFIPAGEVVKVYVCGITPYDTTHLGHAFLYVTFDTLNRFLEWRGLQVRYVQNVTDIDDDVLRKAAQVGLAWDELGRRETARFLEDMAALNVRMPDVYAWATQETPRMIELIEELLAGGHAYVREDNVYFSVKSDPSFGQLAEAAGYRKPRGKAPVIDPGGEPPCLSGGRGQTPHSETLDNWTESRDT